MPLRQPRSRSPEFQARVANDKAIVALSEVTDAVAAVANIGDAVETVGQQVTVATDAASTAVTAAETATAAAGAATSQVTLVFNFQQVRDSYADPDVLTATDTAITIAAHNRHYLSLPAPVAVGAGTITGLTAATDYQVYYDDPTFAGGAVTYAAATTIEGALASLDNPARHYVGAIKTAAAGVTTPTTGTPGAGLPPWKREQLGLDQPDQA